MIRIPGTFNYKCILEGKDPEVRIIQRWDGYRPKINLLLGSFHAYLVDQTIKELQRKKELEKYRKKHRDDVNDIKWIKIRFSGCWQGIHPFYFFSHHCFI